MKKMKRILALIGAILLLCLYISTIIFAFIGSERSRDMLFLSIAGTIVLPVLFYSYILIYRVLNRNHSDEE